ncbi:MAG: hypothetical protein WD030_10530 [Pirellulales bacterium]
MPNIRIFRARIDIGDEVSGLVFSYGSIDEVDEQLGGERLRVWQLERFYVETPEGYELCEVDGIRYVKDPREGDNVYMRAARVVSRVWQNDSGFRIVPSTLYDSLDQEESP